ncbi:TRAP transporter substrate-binding protein [Terasakiella sp. A23]|uniref:TRAP transporter substrate-binding protein n=1 Tax=Terasakiella sp. FCG-A23 TaxID=3080561 RepID=UPI0029549BEC|nr:TRAP transporter substrate-binding protein [Terasakiella sp. A23]MDV7339169.1 TRAP transporter substrate-binding protein [Terasakiella sp. A23]
MFKFSKFALAAAALVALSGQASAKDVWNMPTPYPDGNFHTVNIKAFADDVRAATNGELDIKIHSAGSLVKHPEIKNAVRKGLVPVGEFFLSRLSNENAVFGVDSIPFLATNYEDAKRLWDASRPTIEKELEKQRLKVLFSVPWPPQGLYAKKEINSVDDLKGVKMRAYNALTERLARLSGAVPTQVEVPDIPQAFATGQVEAMITSPSTGANSKAWDFVNNFVDVQAWIPKNIVVVNAKAYNKLSDEAKAAVQKAAEAAEARGWEASKAETASKIKILKDNGMNVSTPSADLLNGLKDAGTKMTADWAKNSGAAGEGILSTYQK